MQERAVQRVSPRVMLSPAFIFKSNRRLTRGRSYTELNDPAVQREMFAGQAKDKVC